MKICQLNDRIIMRIFFGDGEKMTDYTIMTYITNNYVTLLLLAALVILLIVNRKMKISGLQYVWTIMGIVFTLTLCEAFEDICDLYNWDYRLLYIKTALVYWLYPLTAMLELYLVTPIKRKLLIAIPYIINFVLVFIDLFDTHIIRNNSTCSYTTARLYCYILIYNSQRTN